MAHTLSLRPVSPEDDAFLFALYASTRPDIAALPLGDVQRSAVMRMQWLAQRHAYQMRYSHGTHQLVLVEGRPAGRLWVADEPGELRMVDISLLPEHRGAGIGTELLRTVQQEAAAAGKPLRLSVARDNPAQRLYARLGFISVESADPSWDPYLVLGWRHRPREGEHGP